MIAVVAEVDAVAAVDVIAAVDPVDAVLIWGNRASAFFKMVIGHRK